MGKVEVKGEAGRQAKVEAKVERGGEGRRLRLRLRLSGEESSELGMWNVEL